MDFKELSKPFPIDGISFRVGAMNKEKTSGIAFAYIDARDIMQRLDNVCGPANWQALYPHANGKTSCKIGLYVPTTAGGEPDGFEWVWKENGAGDSDVEAEKGAFSDAFKRAAVLWGIGRYLYDFPPVWVDLDQYKKIKPDQMKKLHSSLEKISKGEKVVVEPPKEELPPFTGEEFLALQKEIKESNFPEDINKARDKANSALPRMSTAQKKTIREEITKKATELAGGVK